MPNNRYDETPRCETCLDKQSKLDSEILDFLLSDDFDDCDRSELLDCPECGEIRCHTV